MKELLSILEDFIDLYLKKIFVIFKMYNGFIMYLFGKCIFRCIKGEVSNDVDFFVVDKNVRLLLGV